MAGFPHIWAKKKLPRLGVKNDIIFPCENISTTVPFFYTKMHDFAIKINPEMMRNRFSESKISNFFASSGPSGRAGQEFFNILSKNYQISNKFKDTD